MPPVSDSRPTFKARSTKPGFFSSEVVSEVVVAGASTMAEGLNFGFFLLQELR
jgi:hypothetical protein